MNRTISGIDVSWFQGGGSNPLHAIEWEQVAKDPRVNFVYARATYGSSLVDDTFAYNHDGAKDNHILIGAYHFYRYNADAQEQAEAFLDAVNGREGDLLPMIDVEEGSFIGTPHGDEVQDHLEKTISRIERWYGKRIFIYTNEDTWQTYLNNYDGLAGHPLWVAQSLVPDSLFGGWSRYVLWQQATGTIEVDGIAVQVDYDTLHPTNVLKDIQI